MAFPEKDTLEDFALKANHLAKMTGVALAAHAIGDAFMLMHSGVGCKYKAAAQIARHDTVHHANRKEAWTEISEAHLIAGSGQRIGPYARQWWERRQFGYLVVASAYFVELTGEDLASAVQRLQETVPCPVVLANTATPNGGIFDGYASIMLDVLRRQPFAEPWRDPRKVSTVGFWFHRYEADQKADLAGLRQLYRMAGLDDGPILFSGEPYATLADAHTARFVARLPYAAPAGRKLDRLLKKRDVVRLDLPVGLAGTARFLRELTAATGGDLARTDQAIARQADAIAPRVQQVAGFRGLRAAVFAETPLAAGLVSLLRELGLEVALVGLRDHVLGGAADLHRVLAANGTPLNPDATVLENPSVRRVRREVLDRLDRDDVHLVIGSSVELDTLTHVRSSRGARRWVPLLETGFPSLHQHATVPMPTVGFPGVLSWAQRIADAMLQPRLGIPQALH